MEGKRWALVFSTEQGSAKLGIGLPMKGTYVKICCVTDKCIAMHFYISLKSAYHAEDVSLEYNAWRREPLFKCQEIGCRHARYTRSKATDNRSPNN